ncbi:hypothetical protein [Psychrobacter sp. FDAARGOS_221]|uniref:hypothetical protein n=1 Tax=Psychrobacter sp. FDAARGOS_221 TaxID=1975705 RepID=UPI000BB58F2F|nr:hypothetical protein [Psychrobacter sp. FDAARGOS_221]PNK59728.1 hypothetical protein A6J60_001750 [Psychrobacter sp. FDAARGOS_221]
MTTFKSSHKLTTMGLLLLATVGLTACQSTPTSPVIQRADSTYETTGVGKTKVEAQQKALDSAKKTCGMRQAIVVDDDLKYNGVFDERTGRMVDQVGSIAGAVFGTGKPDLSRDDDYEYEISFRCQ